MLSREDQGADLAIGPRLVRGGLAFWMQTSGACLLAFNRCSPPRVQMPAQGSRSAHRLLYLAAVRANWRVATARALDVPCRASGAGRP